MGRNTVSLSMLSVRLKERRGVGRRREISTVWQKGNAS